MKCSTFIEKNPDLDRKIFRFSSGKRQIFSSGNFKLDINSEFNENTEKTEYSLVIKLETEDSFEKEIIYTYCSISSSGKLEVLKQKIEIGDKALVMNEIYGSSSKEKYDLLKIV